MKPGLNQSTQLRQELKINPRLYQAMDLLYMPLLDLQQHLKQELLNTPFLDLVEAEEDEEEEQEGEATEPAQAETEDERTGEIDWEEILLDEIKEGVIQKLLLQVLLKVEEGHVEQIHRLIEARIDLQLLLEVHAL